VTTWGRPDARGTVHVYVVEMGALYRLTRRQWIAWIRARRRAGATHVDLASFGVMLTTQITNVSDWDARDVDDALVDFCDENDERKG